MIIKRLAFTGLLLLILCPPASAQEAPPPIIDMHIHALAPRAPVPACVPLDPMPVWDPAQPYREVYMALRNAECEDPMISPDSPEAAIAETLQVMRRLNVYGMVSEAPDRVASWVAADPGRFLSGVNLWIDREGREISPDSLRALHDAGRLDVLGEVLNQYSAIAPGDEMMEPYWELAEELDLPVGIHIGIAAPGIRYVGVGRYVARLSDALMLEEVLERHPRLRIYVMHAGYPMLEEMLTVLWAHPQVYVDVGAWIVFAPRAEAERYLRRMVEAGFSKRIMFGSDAQLWPEGIERAIALIQEAEFLTAEQKRDIFYTNAARFLRLSEEEIARHHRGR